MKSNAKAKIKRRPLCHAVTWEDHAGRGHREEFPLTTEGQEAAIRRYQELEKEHFTATRLNIPGPTLPEIAVVTVREETA